VLEHPGLRLVGLHCHLGSQLTSVSAYELAAERMVGLLGELSRRFDFHATQLNLGGGHGIRYTRGDRALDLVAFANRVPEAVRAAYQCSMASGYNLVGRPPVVGVSAGASRLLVRRETEPTCSPGTSPWVPIRIPGRTRTPLKRGLDTGLGADPRTAGA
jgi:hypothetical protein